MGGLRGLCTLVACLVHSWTFFVCYVEFLVGDKELGSNVLTAVYLLFWMSTLSSEGEPILVCKVKDALQRRTAVDGSVVFPEIWYPCYELDGRPNLGREKGCV